MVHTVPLPTSHESRLEVWERDRIESLCNCSLWKNNGEAKNVCHKSMLI